MGDEDDRFGQAVLDQPRVHSAFEGFEAWTRARQEPLELVTAFQTEFDVAALTGTRSQGAARPSSKEPTVTVSGCDSNWRRPRRPTRRPSTEL